MGMPQGYLLIGEDDNYTKRIGNCREGTRRTTDNRVENEIRCTIDELLLLYYNADRRRQQHKLAERGSQLALYGYEAPRRQKGAGVCVGVGVAN